MSFSQFRISSDILRGLKDANVENPTPLQKKIIKAIKDGRDLLIKSDGNDNPETAYLVPVLDHIARQERRQGTKTVVLTPYPERVEKLESWIRTVGVKAEIGSVVITEQGEKNAQKSKMSSGPTAIVATPGRLAELMEENRVVLREVQHLILDSADEFDKTDALQVIMQRIIGKHQRIFSVNDADENSLKRIEKLLTDPFKAGFEESVKPSSISENGNENSQAEAEPESSAGMDEESESKTEAEVEVPGDLTQYYIRVPPRMKISTLIAHLDKTPSDKVIIFAASSRTADRLYRVLRKSGRRASSIHDGLNKNTLDERLGRFTGNDVQHLIVGGISAGELNTGPVTQVINYDVPEETAEYKLRADILGDGRKVRIVSLVSRQDRSDIHEIIENLGYAPEEVPLPDEVRKKSGKSQPKEKKPAKAKEPARARQTARSKASSKPGKKQANKSRGKPRQRPGSRPDINEMEPGAVGELPRPSFDKLSGGRSGRKGEEKSWIKRVFKNLFS